MSKEILSQEEIDALLQGLSEEEEPAGDLMDAILDAALEAAREDDLEVQLRGWEASYPSVDEMLASSDDLWGVIDYGGDVDARGFYRAPAASFRGDEGGEEIDEKMSIQLRSIVEYLVRSAATAIADARGYLVDVRVDDPAPRAPGEESLAGTEWYELNAGIDAPDGGAWNLGILLPPSIRDLIQGTYEELEAESLDPGMPSQARDDASPEAPAARPPAKPDTGTSRDVSPARFPAFGERRGRADQGTGNGRIDMLLDVPLQVSVELGRTVEDIRQITSLGTGSVIELDRQAGEPVDVLVNGKLLARGEVVVVDESFAVRITEIVSLEDRIRNLR